MHMVYLSKWTIGQDPPASVKSWVFVFDGCFRSPQFISVKKDNCFFFLHFLPLHNYCGSNPIVLGDISNDYLQKALIGFVVIGNGELRLSIWGFGFYLCISWKCIIFTKLLIILNSTLMTSLCSFLWKVVFC